MCSNPTCGTLYPTCKVVHTTCVNNVGSKCVLTVADFFSDYAGREIILEIDQAILNSVNDCVLNYGSGQEPMTDRYGNTVHADQLIKEIARRERAKGTKCPAKVAQFRLRVCYDPARFAVICDLPCSNYCANSIRKPKEEIQSEFIIEETTKTTAKK